MLVKISKQLSGTFNKPFAVPMNALLQSTDKQENNRNDKNDNVNGKKKGKKDWLLSVFYCGSLPTVHFLTINKLLR